MVFKMTTKIDPIYTEHIAEILALDFYGNNHMACKVSKFPPSENNTLSFSSSIDVEFFIFPKNSIVIAKPEVVESLVDKGASVVISSEPKYDYCRLFKHLLPPPFYGVHSSAVIGNDVILKEGVSVGAGSVLEGKILVGEGTIIGNNVVIKNKVQIGRNVRIRHGSIIGEDAFSFGFSSKKDVKPDAIRFPSLGGVIIEDNVEIGNNCVISRGTFGDTILGKRVLINDLAHIGNEVFISEGAVVTANTDVSSRVKIGKGCWIGQSASIRQGHVIGDGATVGMGAVVITDVPDDATVLGVPAKVKDLG
tara:strand:- start:13714 stop:14634 length:921 start_codon:yes stop_codon:yes gene_type:complete